MGFIIAVLLAVAAGIFAVSTSHAVTRGNPSVPVVAIDDHGPGIHSHAGAVHEDHSRGKDHAVAQKDCDDLGRGDHVSGGAACCGMGACHAVQAVSGPLLHTPFVTTVVIAEVGDEQVDGIVPGGLERPPRTV